MKKFGFGESLYEELLVYDEVFTEKDPQRGSRKIDVVAN